MEDLKDFYKDRMDRWDKNHIPLPPRLTLDKLLEKVEEDRSVDRVVDTETKEKIDLLKRIAQMMGLNPSLIFKEDTCK